MTRKYPGDEGPGRGYIQKKRAWCKLPYVHDGPRDTPRRRIQRSMRSRWPRPDSRYDVKRYSAEDAMATSRMINHQLSAARHAKCTWMDPGTRHGGGFRVRCAADGPAPTVATT
mmetsp:Transcript_14186/g.38206  ORF Transcript_14186/g.38206 Transcript_14186/m.38206 type:complete len:114 (+) Transcript_14186:161-502(+)